MKKNKENKNILELVLYSINYRVNKLVLYYSNSNSLNNINYILCYTLIIDLLKEILNSFKDFINFKN